MKRRNESTLVVLEAYSSFPFWTSFCRTKLAASKSLCSSKTMHMKGLNSPFQFLTMPLFMSLCFLLISPSATSLNFSYPRFLPNNTADINFFMNASRPNQTDPVIQLALQPNGQSSNASCGRILYAQQMPLWEKASNKLADFTSRFSFAINSDNKSSYADGFAFFLTPNDSLPNNLKTGGSLCLTPNDPFNSTASPFVAVEFDIYTNEEWDPSIGEHVGVDINSIKSEATEPWEGAQALIVAGKRSEAQITYNSTSKNLSIVFTGSRNDTTFWQHLNYTVDLRSYLPENVSFGFTAATGLQFASFEILSWDFNSTLKVQKDSKDPGPQTNANTSLAVGLSVGGLALVVALGLISFGLWKRWKKNSEEEDEEPEYVEEDFESGAGPKRYSYAELVSAASKFKDEQKLGQGGFGSVYKGFLKDTNSYVAIKRVSEDSRQGIREFASEVKIISRLRHRNLVQLIGWCHERKQLLLVYEYMPNGSLDFHLFKNQSLLTWEIRYKIAQGLASALLYLHEECEQCIVHRDIKPSNIMLDSNFNTKLGDFGLARLVDHTKGSRTTYLAGTLGYIAPESITSWRASKETDVYSFGIVALEIACGRKPINYNAPDNEMSMVEWVWELHGNERILEAADPRLGGNFEPDQMKCLMIIGLWCAHPNPYNRPSIRQVIQVLNFEASLPNLPSSLPMLTYVERPILKPSAAQCDSNASVADYDQNPSSSYASNTDSSGFTALSIDISPSVSILYSR